MRFRFYRLRFRFATRDPIHFPRGNPANILRGAFGTIFRRIACLPQCGDTHSCEIRDTCAYARTFEPVSQGQSPSGLADWPRPFVFRAAHLDGLTIPPGQSFHFDVHLFQLREPTFVYFVLAFAQLAREGLGPGRGRANLTAVDQIDPSGARLGRIFDGQAMLGTAPLEPSCVSLDPAAQPVSRLVVRFLTPTELKSGQQTVARPEFPVLIARIRDRLSTLADLYGDGALDLDFAAFGERAAQVRMTACDLKTAHVTRLSTRTGQRHPLGGFTGAASYEGDLGEFRPYLEAACFTGVGRQTTWGKGEISIE